MKPKMLAPNTEIATKKTTGRSRVTNGKQSFMSGEDERGVVARRWRDILRALVSDAGGEETLSAARMSLIRKASTIIVRLEIMEARLIIGDDESVKLDDLEAFARISSQLRRLFETLGLDRVQRDVTPKLADIVEHHFKKAAAKPAERVEPAPATPIAAAPQKPASATRCDAAASNSAVTGAAIADQPSSQDCEDGAPGAPPVSPPKNSGDASAKSSAFGTDTGTGSRMNA